MKKVLFVRSRCIFDLHPNYCHPFCHVFAFVYKKMFSSNFVVLSCSLGTQSKSRILANTCHAWLKSKDLNSSFLDMRDYPLPDFNNDDIFKNSNYIHLKSALEGADSIIISSPIYNWSLSSVVKKIIESTGSHDPDNQISSAWFDKNVTFLCAGGLHHSYMAYSSVAASLMMDFKCIINPHIVYAVESDFQDCEIINPDIIVRIDKVMNVMVEITQRLSGRTYLSSWEV